MLPKERMIKALEHKEPDRVPVGEVGIDYPITEKVLGRKTYYRAKWRQFSSLWEGKRDEVVESYKRDIVELTKKLGLDFVPVFLVPSKKKKFKRPRFLDEYTWEDEEGNVWKFSPQSEGWPICIKHQKVNIDDIPSSIRVDIDESQLELVRYVVKKLGGTHFILGRGPGSSLLGPSLDGTFPCNGGIINFLIRMIDEPEFVEKAIKASTEYAIEIGKILIKEGCNGVLPGSDYSSSQGPMMSPEHFSKYIFPSLKKHCEEFHRLGAYVIKHTDGNTWEILDKMIEAGIDGYQGIQLNAGMDIKKLKEKYGDKLCLFGGVDCETLIAGSEADIRNEVKYAIKYGAPGGGLVITSGNSLMVGVKYQNYLAVLETVKKKGMYPIKI